jgi:hypothetical protein
VLHSFPTRRSSDLEALIDLDSLRVIDGTVRPAVLKEALAWASQNVALLATKWKELNP